MLSLFRSYNLNRLGWSTGLKNARLRDWSRSEKNKLASLLSPRFSILWWACASTIIGIGVILASNTPEWTWGPLAWTLIGLLVAALIAVQTFWVWASRLLGGPERNVGLTARSILLDLQKDAKHRDAYWRRSIVKKVRRFESAGIRAKTLKTFQDGVTKDILGFSGTAVTDQDCSVARENIQSAIEDFSRSGCVDPNAHRPPRSVSDLLKVSSAGVVAVATTVTAILTALNSVSDVF